MIANPAWIWEERLGGTRLCAFPGTKPSNKIPTQTRRNGGIIGSILRPSPYFDEIIRFSNNHVTGVARAVVRAASPLLATHGDQPGFAKHGFFCALLLLTFSSWAAEYRAGLARINITPPIGHEMGYAARKHASTGLHDPLYATMLVIESGDNSLALVTRDLRSFISTRVSELARRSSESRTPSSMSRIRRTTISQGFSLSSVAYAPR